MHEQKKLAILAENATVLELCQKNLSNDFDCHVFKDILSLNEYFQNNSTKVVVIDYDMLSKNNFVNCEEFIQKGSNMMPHVFFVSQKACIEEKIKAFEAGASDFLFIPFDNREFLLRIKSRFRLEEIIPSNSIVLGNCRLDLLARRVYVKNTEVNLTRRQFDILSLLAKKKNQAVSREELIKSICGANDNVSKRNIDTQISYMKKSLKEFDWAFESVHGKGYRLIDPKKELTY